MSASETNQLRMMVTDDGIGLPKDLDISTTRSLGLRLVRILTGQLKGEMLVERDQGTRFVITFLLKESIKR